MEVRLYNQKGEALGETTLPEKLFNLPWNPQLVHQAFLAERTNRRRATAHTKDRSEVRGGGRKPWRQKGTGRARHGSIRSPLWAGGGVTHGPRKEKDYKVKINKKARRLALLTILAQKLRDAEILFLDDLKITEAKTKNGVQVLKNLSKIQGFEKVDPKARTLVLLPGKDEATWRAFRNIANITLGEARNLNASLLLSNRFLIMTQESSRVIAETFLK